MVIFWTNKARVSYDTITKDQRGRGLYPIWRWNDIKELFLNKYLSIGLQSQILLKKNVQTRIL